MVYTPEQKAEIDNILRVFEKYIKEHPCFDIVYSEKLGYLNIVIESDDFETVAQIPSQTRVTDILFNEMVNDVIYGPDSGEHYMDGILSEKEKEGVRGLLARILKNARKVEQVYYRTLLERYFERFPRGFYTVE